MLFTENSPVSTGLKNDIGVKGVVVIYEWGEGGK